MFPQYATIARNPRMADRFADLPLQVMEDAGFRECGSFPDFRSEWESPGRLAGRSALEKLLRPSGSTLIKSKVV
ncbi:MAG TPA: hypothetical protein H9899_06225 [Candidatus Sphingomonas excrementigallinarum]|nr:hypothetical protein [Candidatus Sphingomonas excrementigallinarum]